MNETFKNFILSVIKEDESAETSTVGLQNALHGWHGDASPNLDMNDLFNIHRKDILDRLNQYVESVSGRTYVNPGTAIARMRDKLTIVGLSIPVMPVKEGVDRLPVMQFGGVFNPYTGKTDDKIAEQLGHGIDLVVNVTRYGPRFGVSAKLVSSNDPNPFGPSAPVTKESYEYAKNVGDRIGVDWSKVDLKEFAKGLEVEKEHNDVTKGDVVKTAKIAIAHLKELPNYYSKLATIEN